MIAFTPRVGIGQHPFHRHHPRLRSHSWLYTSTHFIPWNAEGVLLSPQMTGSYACQLELQGRDMRKPIEVNTVKDNHVILNFWLGLSWVLHRI